MKTGECRLKTERFQPGIDVLLARHKRWLRGARVGLVSHLAAVNGAGATTAELLQASGLCRLTALFGPEHGFAGAAGAGTRVAHRRHPVWGIPVYSLYGAARRPTPGMFRHLDALVLDLQDLGARPYTYVSTLRYVLEAAAAANKPVIIADRPIPLPQVADGPMLDEAQGSFVGAIPAPMCYGMTPGETALWLRQRLNLDTDVRTAKMQGYHRQPGRDADWPPWLPPSPGIRAWETARCYTATVFSEALPAVDIGRGTNMAFQVFGAAWMRAAPVLDWLRAQKLPGVNFYAHPYQPAGMGGRLFDGVRIAARDTVRFRPVTTSLAIIECLQKLYGIKKIWRAPHTRPTFFDQLYGTTRTRLDLTAGAGWRAISAGWRGDLRRFEAGRRAVLLY